MNRARTRSVALLLLLSLSFASPLLAGSLPAASPRATLTQSIGLAEVSITYSRPRVRGRVIWGELVPYGEVWRTGADYPTRFEVGADLEVEGQTLPAGAYALYTIPGPERWTVVFSRDLELWGAFGYSPEHDQLRVEVEPRAAEPTESFTIELAEVTLDRAELRLRWDRLEVPVRLRVDDRAAVREQVESAEADAWGLWWRGAHYLLETGGDLALARRWIDRSLATERNWMNTWTSAEVHAAAGATEAAVAAGREAIEICHAEREHCPYTEVYRRTVESWAARSAREAVRSFVQPVSWSEPFEPFAIAEGLYSVGSAELTALLVTTAEGHVLIDVPLDRNVEMVWSNIEKLGFDPTDVEIQLTSHAHFDHVGGVAPILERTGARLVASAPDAELLAAGGRGGFFDLGEIGLFPPARVTETVEHLGEVRLGGVALTAHLTPGHTRGCTSWSGTVAIDGEPLRWVSVCSLSVLPGYRLAGDQSYPGIARDFCTSVEHLESLEPDVFLAAHASFFEFERKAAALRAGDRRAFVDPDGYRAFLEGARGRIEEALAEQGFAGGCAEVLER